MPYQDHLLAVAASLIQNRADPPETSEGHLMWLAQIHADLGDCHRARRVAELLIDPSRRTRAFSNIAAKCAHAGQRLAASELFSEALRAAETIGDDFKDHGLGQLAEKCAEAGELEVGLAAARIIGDPYERAVALIKIAALLRVRPDLDAAELLSEAFRAAVKIHNEDDRGYATAELAAMYARIGLGKQAFDVVESIGDPLHQAKARIAIADRYIDVAEVDSALHLLAEVHRRAEEEPSCAADWVLGDLSVSYARAGECGEAFRAADGIQAASWKARALAQVAAECAARGQYCDALQVARSIDLPLGRAHAFASVGARYAAAGCKDDSAAALAEAFQIAQVAGCSDDDKAEALERIAEGYRENGSYDSAFHVLASVPCPPGNYHLAVRKARALTDLARAYRKAGGNPRAVEVLSQALSAAKSIGTAEVYGLIPTLLDIAVEFLRAGSADSAFSVLADTVRAANQWHAANRDFFIKVWTAVWAAFTYTEAGQELDERSQRKLEELLD